MTGPKVTIMIPAYNQAGFIERSIRSALDQDYANLEVIVADDCSPDGTAAVAEALIKQLGDPRVRCIRHSSNLGILRNYYTTLYDHATGDWAVNLDADDFFVDRSFIARCMAARAAGTDVVLVFANYREHFEATGRHTDIRNGPHPPIMDDRQFLDLYADEKIIWNHNSIVYDRHAAMAVGCYWDPAVPRNDWDSFLRLAVGHKVAFVDTIAAAWVQHDANETRRLDLQKYLNNFALIDGVAAYARKQGLSDAFVSTWTRRMVVRSAKSSSIGYLRNRDYRGLAVFLRTVARRDALLPVKVLGDPAMLGRAAVSVSPGLYNLTKSAMHAARRRIALRNG